VKVSYRSLNLLVLIALILSGCSRKKDKFLNRGFHSMTTKYNYLYNGNNLLNQGKFEINENVFDNFWEILPTEKTQVKEEQTKLKIKDEQSASLFAQSEEKAVLAIQKHAMNISGKEKNPQMDEAYFLLGQSRYYDQRFIPSLEAFNYILFKYPTSELVNKAKIWREKINAKQNYNELAIENLKEIESRGKLPKEEIIDLNVVLTQAYLNSKKIDSAIIHLEIASKATQDLNKKSRYLFILGQLYKKLEKLDSSTMAYDRVIKLYRKIPREYYVYSFVEKSKNYNDKNLGISELIELEKDIENKAYLNIIYHQIANLNFETNNDSLAISYYNKSLRNPGKDDLVSLKNYNILADYFFDNNKYLKSAAYYDSTLTQIKDDKKLFRKITKRRESLEDVIYYELSVKTNDSILSLVKMSDEERTAYFKDYIEKQKKKLDNEKETINSKNESNISSFKNNNLSSENSMFYFYNPTTLAYGKNEFNKLWGDIKLTDNWRNGGNQPKPKSLSMIGKENSKISTSQDLGGYLKSIPSSTPSIDSLYKQLDYSYFQLASIYSAKFLEYELSNNKIQNIEFDRNKPEFVLSAKYLNYKNCIILGLPDEAEVIKSDIILNFPESKYAEILNNPESNISSNVDNVNELYAELFEDFQNQDYSKTILGLEKLISSFETHPLAPKMQLLKASAIARIEGFENYKTALEFIVKNYPNSTESDEAEVLLEDVLPLVENPNFKQVENGDNFKLIYSFTKENYKKIEDFKQSLNLAISDLKNIQINSSIDVFNNDSTFVVLHGLKSYDGANGLSIILEQNDALFNKSSFVISSENYRTLQMHKNLSVYLNKNL
jgi:outer membrane protein assembly factor BamD (BamD/ComL family)